MKRNLMAIIFSMCLFFTSCAGAEGVLPSLQDTIGKPMPSLGQALSRYPDEESMTDDGGSVEVFQKVTETDFNLFSVYLSDKKAVLEDYQTAGNSFSAAIQVEKKTIFFTYDIQSLVAKVTYPKGTYDEWLDYAKVQFEYVVDLLDAGQTDEGIKALFLIPCYSGYRPVVEYLETHPQIAAAIKVAQFQNVGGYVTFGSYEQDNNMENGKEPIEWMVLDYDSANERSLLLSHYGLDEKPYHSNHEKTTWEECSLRTWLNEDFINNAFIMLEQQNILTTELDNTKRYKEWHGAWGGHDTQDKIFLLSFEEAEKYLGVTVEDKSNMKSRVTPTAYAISQGASTNDDFETVDGAVTGWWWLRSPGERQIDAACVRNDGSLDNRPYGYEYDGCIRPALWINLKSGIF